MLEGRKLLGSAVSIRAGDYVAPAKSNQGACQVADESESFLRYPRFSTRVEPDVIVYPDSRRVGAFAGDALDGFSRRESCTHLRASAEVGYHNGGD